MLKFRASYAMYHYVSVCMYICAQKARPFSTPECIMVCRAQVVILNKTYVSRQFTLAINTVQHIWRMLQPGTGASRYMTIIQIHIPRSTKANTAEPTRDITTRVHHIPSPIDHQFERSCANVVRHICITMRKP